MASFLSTIHVDTPLSNVSIQYKNKELVADRIFPQIQVAKKSDKYFIYNKADAFTQIQPLTNHLADVGEVNYSVSTGSYSCLDYALKEFVSRDVIENADAPLQPLIDTTENITQRLLLDREIKLAAQLFSTSVISNNLDLTAGTKWTSASSEPISQILTGLDSIVGVPGPFCVLFGRAAWRSFRTHPDVLSAFQYNTSGVAATEQDVKNFFGFEDVIIGNGFKNTAALNATASYSDIWGDSVLIFKRGTSLAVKEVALGYCMRFGNMEVQRWQDFNRGARGGEMVKVGWSYADEITAVDAAYLIDDVN